MKLLFRKPKYEVILWVTIVTTTILAIVDRFTTNLWPRQSFAIGTGSAGNDRMIGFKEGPWSVVLYDVLARISGRFSIVCFNFMLASRFHVLEQCIASSWIAKYVLDCSNITKSNIQAHKWCGIALVVLTLLHVWSILMPCVTHKWRAQVVPGQFEWPLSERAPPGFKDADVATETMSLQMDDVFRMVEMTLLLGVLTPLSIRWMAHCWHIGIHVHRFVAVIYFVDIVRRHSHPHSWVLNTPIFVLWIFDKFVCLFWREVVFPDVIRQVISEDYIVLYWTADQPSASDNTFNDTTDVGSIYYMKMHPSSWLESRHPFTSFKNRAGNCNFMYPGLYHTQDKLNSARGAVIRTFHNARKPRIVGGENGSQTGRMAEEESLSSSCLSIYGPFQGHLTNIIRKAFPTERDGFASAEEGSSVVLAGSGSAINFLLDFLSIQTSREAFDLRSPKLKQVVLLHSTRDRALHEWVVGVVDHLLGSVDVNFGEVVEPKIRIVLACTSDSNIMKEDSVAPLDRTFSLEEDFILCDDTTCNRLEGGQKESTDSRGENADASLNQTHPSGSIELYSKRLDYAQEIPSGSHVFCQGSEGFKAVVSAGCRGKKGVCLYLE